MGRKSIKDVRQLEIIKAFYKLAKKEGYENSSIAKIANEMGVNPTLIIHYFKTKENLTYALIDYILDRYLLIYSIKEKGMLSDLHKTIEALFSKKWNLLFDDGLFYAFYALAFRDKKIKAKYKIILDSLRNTLALIIERCNQQGLIKVADPKVAADLIFVLVDGSYFYLSLEDDKAAFSEKVDFYKNKAYEILGIEP
ncbi:TetR family transcriptional regulator [Pedobacter cryoconitis]|uniref:Biofilm operon icaADBC HTH-type negative transcriptional regulator IcaR n=1 Tax=Pedobacter cryoconitis TaxID=188932 RepID=A0A7X0IZP8_9SPHI|nr:TetR family transcriptional regulator [Pedobacter cryoconitis]MBB6498389.1 AcrR family transcriptional regulator [Pedobacter cryoconitis]